MSTAGQASSGGSCTRSDGASLLLFSPARVCFLGLVERLKKTRRRGFPPLDAFAPCLLGTHRSAARKTPRRIESIFRARSFRFPKGPRRKKAEETIARERVFRFLYGPSSVRLSRKTKNRVKLDRRSAGELVVARAPRHVTAAFFVVVPSPRTRQLPRRLNSSLLFSLLSSLSSLFSLLLTVSLPPRFWSSSFKKNTATTASLPSLHAPLAAPLPPRFLLSSADGNYRVASIFTISN